MFELLTRLVLWVLLVYFIWYVLLQLVPQINVKWLVPIVLFVLVMLGFLFPNDRSIATVWNIISFPLKPIGLCIVFLIIAYSKGKDSSVPKKIQNLILSVLMILVFSSLPWVSEKLEFSMIRTNLNYSEICTQQNANNQNKLIVMLANGVSQPGGPYRPAEQILEMSDRLLQTSREYQRNFASLPAGGVLVASRKQPGAATAQNPSEFDLIRDQLINLGVARSDIFNLDNLFDTFNVKQTSQAITEYIDTRGLSGYQVIVVSSAMDVGRVKLTLERALGENRQISVRASSWELSNKFCPEQKRYPDLVDLIPTDSSVLRSSRFVDEFFTSSYYFLRNWLVPCWDCWESVPTSSNPDPFKTGIIQ